MSGNVSGTSNAWPTYSKGNGAAEKNGNRGTLGKDDFLKILVAQLKNQDPAQPLQDREFIAQMAQFSSVEQIMNMAGEMKLMRQSMGIASNLIGKTVSWLEASGSTTQTKTGIVEAISIKDGVQYANVEGEEISLDRLVKVATAEERE